MKPGRTNIELAQGASSAVTFSLGEDLTGRRAAITIVDATGATVLSLAAACGGLEPEELRVYAEGSVTFDPKPTTTEALSLMNGPLRYQLDVTTVDGHPERWLIGECPVVPGVREF